MEVYFSRGSQEKRNLSLEMIEFVENKLMSDINEKIILKITFESQLVKKELINGECSSYPKHSFNEPSEFEIKLNSSLPLRDLMETLAHELVHVKQYAKGELRDSKVNKQVVFQNRTYDVEDMDYWDHPWEIEAHGRETGLFIRWAEKYGHAHKKWTQK